MQLDTIINKLSIKCVKKTIKIEPEYFHIKILGECFVDINCKTLIITV
jgi:hypothetical protein